MSLTTEKRLSVCDPLCRSRGVPLSDRRWGADTRTEAPPTLDAESACQIPLCKTKHSAWRYFTDCVFLASNAAWVNQLGLT